MPYPLLPHEPIDPQEATVRPWSALLLVVLLVAIIVAAVVQLLQAQAL